MTPETRQLAGGVYVARYVEVPGSASTGVTPDEAMKGAYDQAYVLMLEELERAATSGALDPVQVSILPGLRRRVGRACAGCFHLAAAWYARHLTGRGGPLFPTGLASALASSRGPVLGSPP